MPSPNPFPGSPNILSVSRDAMLLASRNAVLRSAGYVVETTMQDDQALEILKRGGIDGVVLGDSIKPDQRNALARAIKELAPKVPILVLKISGEDAPPEAAACMDSLDGPEVLLQKLSQILRTSDAQAA